MRYNRRYALGATLLALAFVAVACGSGGGTTGTTSPKGTLTVGVSGGFAENQIVAEMYAQVLEHAGYTVKRQLDIQNREASEPALKSGVIDLKPEYIGTLLLFVNPQASASADPAQEASALKPLLAATGITLLNYSQANDTNAFVVTKATADKYHLAKVSDLASVAGQLTLGGPPECPQRPFCIPGLKTTYGVTFGHFNPIGACDSATADALDAGAIDVALLCSTQSVISAKGWVALEDDKHLQKADNIAPVVRTSVDNAEINRLLNAVSAKLTTENILPLNKAVEIDHEDAAVVAKKFLQDNGLLS